MELVQCTRDRCLSTQRNVTTFDELIFRCHICVLAHTCLLTPVYFKNTAKQRIINLSPSKIIKLLYVGTFLWYVLTCTTTYHLVPVRNFPTTCLYVQTLNRLLF